MAGAETAWTEVTREEVRDDFDELITPASAPFCVKTKKGALATRGAGDRQRITRSEAR